MVLPTIIFIKNVETDKKKWEFRHFIRNYFVPLNTTDTQQIHNSIALEDQLKA